MSPGRDSHRRRIMADPLLLGLVTLAVAAVTVFLAYRAQDGLPWTSFYRVHADVPDAAKLLKNADVRIGGARVGQVLGIHAEPAGPGHGPFARLDLALDADAGPLPADTTAEVRLASVLGGKFLDLVPGKATGTIPGDGVIPLRNARPAIDTDEALLVFSPESRRAIRATIGALGGAFAGRGQTLNATIESAARSLPAAERVLAVLARRSTDLAGFVRGAAAAATALAPLAGRLPALMEDAATTFRALDDPALDRVLAATPPAELSATRAFDAVAPVLDDARAVVRSLAPAGAILPQSLANVGAAVTTATPVTRRIGRLAGPMDQALRAVDAFSRNPSATGAIQALGGNDLATFGGSAFIGLGAILRTTAAAQLNCNATALWMRNLADVASEGDAGGNWLRMVPVFALSQTSRQPTPAPDLHVNYYPNENATECESGNEPYASGQAIGNPPGKQATTTATTTQAAPGR